MHIYHTNVAIIDLMSVQTGRALNMVHGIYTNGSMLSDVTSVCTRICTYIHIMQMVQSNIAIHIIHILDCAIPIAKLARPDFDLSVRSYMDIDW